MWLYADDSFDLEDICRSALMRAIEHQAQVRFVYKGTEYRVSYSDLRASIKGEEPK
jgi:hypothetical protein